jgi:hypothetical protein
VKPYSSLEEYVKVGTGEFDSKFSEFVERGFELPVQPTPQPVVQLPSPAPVKEKIDKLESELEATRKELVHIQTNQESAMVSKFEEIYHQQLQELLPTVSTYFEKIRYAGMVESRDDEWRRVLDDEIRAAEKYFKKKTKAEIELAKNKVVADMKASHSQDLERLTAAINKSNEIRD